MLFRSGRSIQTLGLRKNYMSDLAKLLEFLCELETQKMAYRLEHNRAEAVMVLIAVPGERWEVEFFEGGAVEIERFGNSSGVCSGEEASRLLAQLFAVHGS